MKEWRRVQIHQSNVFLAIRKSELLMIGINPDKAKEIKYKVTPENGKLIIEFQAKRKLF